MNRLIRFSLVLATAGLMVTLFSSSKAFGAGGGCSAFAGNSCPANIPSGVTSFYFIDYASGSDSNPGTSEASPWQHLPTCANATGSAAAHTPGSGEGWILKGGVTIGSQCFPASLPWGGASGTPDYLGYDPGWYTGSSWARPIINGGGSSGYDATTRGLLTDVNHRASYLIIDNLEFTGLYWSGTCPADSTIACAYVAMNDYFSQGQETHWEFKNIYAHNITHCGSYPACNDPGNGNALFWMPNTNSEGGNGTSSMHDSVFDNTDGAQDCCQPVHVSNVYNNYVSGFTNFIFNETNTVHDNYVANFATTFVPQPTEPHGNCIHLFGVSNTNELVWNNYVQCDNPNAEALLLEEDSATVYAFNNVWSEISQPNGLSMSSFSGAGAGGTYKLFNNTIAAGMNSPGGYSYEAMKFFFHPKITVAGNFAITNNNSEQTVFYSNGSTAFTGTYNYTPSAFSKSCPGGQSNPQTNWNGNQICAPVGSGNGTGNLNMGETYPFAPMDSTAAATVGSAANSSSLCSEISAINAAAGTACMSDTTLGVSYNQANHTVSWPGRQPVARSSSGQWTNGAYQSGNSTSQTPNPPTGLAATVN
jgi:hypothetical protein